MTAADTAALLSAWDNILVLTHKRPDGDTIGCAAALCALLRAQGKTAYALPALDANALLAPYLAPYLAPEDFSPAQVVSVDVASTGLLPDNARVWLDRGIDLAIDHHPSNEGFARHNLIEPHRAACGEIIYLLARALLGDAPLPAEVALPLYLAVSTDTGCFVYSNTTAHTHAVTAALMETGIDAFAVNKAHFRTKSLARLKLESILTESMELYDNGETALVSVTLDTLRAIQATDDDTENISAFAPQVAGVKTAATLREYPGGEVRISLRTNGGLNATKVCALLGGGGHAAASGCCVKGTMEQAKAAILGAIRAVQAEG